MERLSGASHTPADKATVQGFWSERRGAAALKHGVLRRYLVVYVTKTGTYAPGRRVVYFDGFAGRGRYEDGAEGSPLIAAEVAQRVAKMKNPRRLECFLVEKNKSDYRRLRDVLDQEAAHIGPQVRCGEVGDFVDEVLSFTSQSPLFAFLDPYGLGLPFDAVVKLLARPRDTWGRPQTEVLINFSDIMVRRIGGLLTTTKPGPRDSTTLARMDATCGGSWWRDAYRDTHPRSRAVEAIITEYSRLVGKHVGCVSWRVPVRNRVDHEPRYYLLLFTRHRDGLWEFGENLSLATADWRRAYAHPPPIDHQPALFEFPDLERELEARWVNVITGNIAGLLDADQAPFKIWDHYVAVMGETLGLAREKHVRAAVKRLHEDGRTATTGSGRVDAMTVLPPVGR